MPTNVRVRLIDGSVHPVELAYAGLDEDGCHLWAQIRPDPFPFSEFSGAGAILCDKLPAKCAISIALDEER